MLKTAQIIVLHCQKHSDKASILHSYSRENGRDNFILYNSHKNRSLAGGLAHFPLVILEVSYDDKKTQEMKVIRSISPAFIPTTDDGEKQCVRMVLGEVLYRTLRHPMADSTIYSFLVDTIRQIDTEPRAQVLLHPFLQHFSELLGYGGEWLEEWNELKSLDLLREMLD